MSGCARRPEPERDVLIVGAAKSMQVISRVVAHGVPLGQGLVFWDLDRLAGPARVQRADRVRHGERDLSPEPCFEAYDRMMSGKARFRVVLTIGD